MAFDRKSGPSREVKVLAICTAETEVTYLQAVKAKLWKLQMCIEREEAEDSEFVQAYLVAKVVDEITTKFCQEYGVKILKV